MSLSKWEHCLTCEPRAVCPPLSDGLHLQLSNGKMSLRSFIIIRRFYCSSLQRLFTALPTASSWCVNKPTWSRDRAEGEKSEGNRREEEEEGAWLFIVAKVVNGKEKVG